MRGGGDGDGVERARDRDLEDEEEEEEEEAEEEEALRARRRLRWRLERERERERDGLRAMATAGAFGGGSRNIRPIGIEILYEIHMTLGLAEIQTHFLWDGFQAKSVFIFRENDQIGMR